jgi:hypothetical protein
VIEEKRRLPAYVVDTLAKACTARGRARVYREARVSDTAMRRATDGHLVSQYVHDRLCSFADAWLMQHPGERHAL